jgi:hypothetical protein
MILQRVINDIKKRAGHTREKASPKGVLMKNRLCIFGTVNFPCYSEWRLMRADRYWPLDDERRNIEVDMWLVPGSQFVTL